MRTTPRRDPWISDGTRGDLIVSTRGNTVSNERQVSSGAKLIRGVIKPPANGAGGPLSPQQVSSKHIRRTGK